MTYPLVTWARDKAAGHKREADILARANELDRIKRAMDACPKACCPEFDALLKESSGAWNALKSLLDELKLSPY